MKIFKENPNTSQSYSGNFLFQILQSFWLMNAECTEMLTGHLAFQVNTCDAIGMQRWTWILYAWGSQHEKTTANHCFGFFPLLIYMSLTYITKQWKTGSATAGTNISGGFQWTSGDEFKLYLMWWTQTLPQVMNSNSTSAVLEISLKSEEKLDVLSQWSLM